jgi:hypothetical protein
MKKWLKVILICAAIIILSYLLYPKDIGFTEQTMGITIGEYSQCLGIKLSDVEGVRTNFKCIGIPFGKTTI